MNRYLETLRNLALRTKASYPSLVPVNKRHDDVYLVAFPKSGITWLSTLIAQLLLDLSGSDRKVNFFNLESFIPDIHVSTDIPNSAELPLLGQRVIKSHSTFNRDYNHLIYLVRDPRDVLVSFWYFMTSLGYFEGSISSFIRDPSFGAKAWNSHVVGWWSSIEPSTLANFYQYEELTSEPELVLGRVANLFGFSVDAEIVSKVIADHSFVRMKESEQKYREYNRTIGSEHQFIRKGRTGAFLEELKAEDIDYIESAAAEGMALYGYLPRN